MTENEQVNNQQVSGVTPEEYGPLHKVLMSVAAFFFFYLIIEAFVLLPGLIWAYGTH